MNNFLLEYEKNFIKIIYDKYNRNLKISELKDTKFIHPIKSFLTKW